MSAKILIVDDDTEVCQAVAEHFVKFGFQNESAHTDAEMCKVLARECYAMVILDVVLPDEDGISLLRRWRRPGRCARLRERTSRPSPAGAAGCRRRKSAGPSSVRTGPPAARRCCRPAPGGWRAPAPLRARSSR
ncbi:response regulator transcription factor [Verminephrobacter sp. Larva24]|nr:response regulator transcription factor [Verminephrobacter sp. Larva24]